MTRRGRLRVGPIALAAVVGGCGSSVIPSSVHFVDERIIRLETSCAHDVTASLTETETEVRIDDVRGDDQSTHDCSGETGITLVDPIGDRDLVIEGDRWVRVDDDCEIPAFISPERAAARQANQPRSCPPGD